MHASLHPQPAAPSRRCYQQPQHHLARPAVPSLCSPGRRARHNQQRPAPQPLRATNNTDNSTSAAAAAAAAERDRGLALRAEAEAPFRILRLVFSGFSVVSASIALLVSLPQLAGALGGAQGAMQRDDVLLNIAIDGGAALLFGLLFRADWQARDKQMARIAREEALGDLPLALANGKNLPLAALRGSARPVLVAGTKQQVEAAVAAAEPFRRELQRRGVVVVAAPIYEDESGGVAVAGAGTNSPTAVMAAAVAAAAAEQQGQAGGGGDGQQEAAAAAAKKAADDLLRWRAAVRKPAAWREWFDMQIGNSKASADKGGAGAAKGLFVGLRLDGRVRSSGLGTPPWARYAAELPPLEGEKSWTGFFSSFDGRV
jgi:hypothetical protein